MTSTHANEACAIPRKTVVSGRLAALLWDAGLYALLFLGALTAFCAVQWAVNLLVGTLLGDSVLAARGVSGLGVLVASLAAAGAGLWFVRRGQSSVWAWGALLSIAVLAACVGLSGLVYDKSYDGNSYHKLAVGYIKEGWNPLYESSEAFNARAGIAFDSRKSIWLDHYAKATWSFGASVYSVTGNIESGKAYTLFGMWAAFALGYGFLRRRYLSGWQSAAAALALALNPVAVAQCMTYYIDGFLFVMLYCLLICLAALSHKLEERPAAWAGVGCAVAVLANIKFTGLVFAAAYCLAFYAWWMARARGKAGLRLTLGFSALALAAVFAVGAPTYLTNALQHQNPLYPLVGPGSVDIITENQPAAFEDMPGLKKLFVSLFAQVDNLKKGSTDQSPALKLPFTFTAQEIARLGSGDLRQSGFGPFFSGILLLCAAALVFGVMRVWNRNHDAAATMVVVAATSLALAVIFGESWWARYAPHIYALAVTALCALFGAARTGSAYPVRRKIVSVSAWALAALMFVNVSFFGLGRVNDFRNSITVRAQMRAFQSARIQEAYLTVGNKQGLVFNVRDIKPGLVLGNTANDENAPRDLEGYVSIYFDQIVYKPAA